MHRNEFKTLAEGFKKARPIHVQGHEHDWQIRQMAWEESVACVADAFRLTGKPRSNFEAACGVIKHDDVPVDR